MLRDVMSLTRHNMIRECNERLYLKAHLPTCIFISFMKSRSGVATGGQRVSAGQRLHAWGRCLGGPEAPQGCARIPRGAPREAV